MLNFFSGGILSRSEQINKSCDARCGEYSACESIYKPNSYRFLHTNFWVLLKHEFFAYTIGENKEENKVTPLTPKVASFWAYGNKVDIVGRRKR